MKVYGTQNSDMNFNILQTRQLLASKKKKRGFASGIKKSFKCSDPRNDIVLL